MRSHVRWSNQLRDGAVLLRAPLAAAADTSDLEQDIAAADRWAERARLIATGFGRDTGITHALEFAQELGSSLRPVGEGDTITLLEALATVAAADLSVVRVIEPHLDALAILRQAREVSDHPVRPEHASTWGVFAAESPSTRLEAVKDAHGWTLSGRKPWCSMAGTVSHAVVTARAGDGDLRAFAVDLRGTGVRVEEPEGPSYGLGVIPSVPVSFENVVAHPLGGPNWFLERPGHAWGGVAVAACWYGGAVGVARRLTQAARQRTFDQIGRMQQGELDVLLHLGRAVLAEAAAQIDAGSAIGVDARVLALRVRSTVARLVDSMSFQANRAPGPGPLALEEGHSRRVADLAVYVRQEHGPRDAAALGEILEKAATTGA